MMPFITPVVFQKKYGSIIRKTVVDRSRTQFSQVHLNDRFYSFLVKMQGSEQWSVVLFAPKTKGSVEALARTMDRLRVYNHEFYDSTDLIRIVDELCDGIKFGKCLKQRTRFLIYFGKLMKKSTSISKR